MKSMVCLLGLFIFAVLIVMMQLSSVAAMASPHTISEDGEGGGGKSRSSIREEKEDEGCPCRFAPLFPSSSHLLNNKSAQQNFLRFYFCRELKFMKEVGVNNETQLTYDGHRLNLETGLLQGEPHLFSAPSKESLHLGVLTKVLYNHAKGMMKKNKNQPEAAENAFRGRKRGERNWSENHIFNIKKLEENDDFATADLSNNLFTVQEIFDILEVKLRSYEQFHETYPGFGGFLPWFSFSTASEERTSGTQGNKAIGQEEQSLAWEEGKKARIKKSDTHRKSKKVVKVSPAWNWQNRVPSLDNGEWFWSVYALTYVLKTYYPRHNFTKQPDDASSAFLSSSFEQRWENVYQRMVKNAVPVFYHGRDGLFRTVTYIGNQTLPVENNSYAGPPGNGKGGFLDDPYEGELFTDMIDLLVPDTVFSAAEKSKMWIQKRKKLQLANLEVHTSFGSSKSAKQQRISVQKGWWFSAHEQWKYLMLPYQSASPVNRRVFQNGERARTWYATTIQKSPGMWASVNGPITNNSENFPYDSACGIGPIAFENVTDDDVITPYSVFPLFLVNSSYALVWLHNMLLSKKGQNIFGTTESMRVNGKQVAPLTTWDSKISTLLAVLGGLSDVNEEALQNDKLLQKFSGRIESEWSRVFPLAAKGKEMPGEQLPFQLPENKVPIEYLSDFTSCLQDGER